MDIAEKTVSGIAIAVIVALVLYAFRVRQLYLLVPKMFGYSALTERGKILELRAFNRGRSMEEDVHVDMPPALTYELIAADHPDVKLEKNKLILSRIGPRSEVSIILMAEGAIEAESFAPTLSSKTTKGKIVKKLEEVPPNAGVVVLSITGFLMFFALMFFIPQKWIDYQKEKTEDEKKQVLKRYSFLEQAGWRGLDRYVFSEARGSYAGFEFPVLFNSAQRKGNTVEIQFSATNKTAAPLKVTAFVKSEKDDGSLPDLKSESVFDIPVNPMQSIPILIKTDIPTDYPKERLFVQFYLKFADEDLLAFQFYPSLNKAANQVLQGMPAIRRL